MGATEMAALSGLIMAVKSAAPAVVESLNNAYDFAVGDWIRSWNDKRKVKLQYNLDEYKLALYKNINQIPNDEMKEPDLSILGPALDATKYYIEDKTMRDLFAHVAAGAMDSRLDGINRSAFVEFIKQMTPLDARILRQMQTEVLIKNGDKTLHIAAGGPIPIIDVSSRDDRSMQIINENIVPDSLVDTLKVKGFSEVASSIDNLSRLSIIEKHIGGLSSWRMKSITEWFKNNSAVMLAQENLEKEREQYRSDIHKRDNREIVEKDGVKTIKTYAFTEDLDAGLRQAEQRRIVKENAFIKLTSLGENFCKVCLPSANDK